MSTFEKRAWLTLWTMCPGYLVYFAVQIFYPQLTPTVLSRFGLLALVAGLHAVGYVVGLLVMKWRDRDDGLVEDERDRAIDARATRAAYFLLLAGTILTGMVMPFTESGWKVVNTALLFIVLSETLRVLLTVRGYRQPRLVR
ncbi:DUF2178 domain-containing protein [Lysobacter sp. Root494]|uniref:DUF2178 domain-containing protein n=1 Tax=Lysobacter sp. Root494 TaxID=1736549 RepID=UPI0006F609E4|nr:DUF2178 domain-containing protein [Lysobacter sp. Root494]KQY52216.1 hypothetical protein ASD14_06120 [Lysobacter sp. Root494]